MGWQKLLGLAAKNGSNFSPWGLAATGASVGLGLLGGRGGGHDSLDQGSIDRALNLGKADPFKFQLDENDPQLDYMRRQSLRRGQDTARGTMDEIGRAGLLGSGASFRLMNRDNLNLNRDLEDNEGQIYGARRSEAHGDYTDELGFRRGLARDVLGFDSGSQRANENEKGAAQSQIGEFGGSMLRDYWRRRYLNPVDLEGDSHPYSPAEIKGREYDSSTYGPQWGYDNPEYGWMGGQ